MRAARIADTNIARTIPMPIIAHSFPNLSINEKFSQFLKRGPLSSVTQYPLSNSPFDL